MIAWRLREFAELPSTSDECIRAAKAGEPEGLAILAARQSAGRGSRGRAWVSPPGNVALSVLLRPAVTPAQTSVFPLLAGLAAARAIAAVLAPAIRPLLKWPNDVLLKGEKCAGVLIDAAPGQSQVDWLVVGIGVNLAYAPEIPGRATTCLAAHGADIDAPDLARFILDKLAAALDTLAAAGPAAIIDFWLALAHPIGTPLAVKSHGQTLEGAFAGLSPAGELLLRLENRIEKISTGEILLTGVS